MRSRRRQLRRPAIGYESRSHGEAISAFQENGRINPDQHLSRRSRHGGSAQDRSRSICQRRRKRSGIRDRRSLRSGSPPSCAKPKASSVVVGKELTFSLLALPGRTLTGRINYIAAGIDPATRRLLIRATVDNTSGQLKPEMFATVTIHAYSDQPSIGVPKGGADLRGRPGPSLGRARGQVD